MTGAWKLPDDVSPVLLTMALVAQGQAPDDEYGRAFQALLQKDPAAFAKKHVELETAYWMARPSLGGSMSESNVGGAAAAVALDRWMKDEQL